LAALKLLQFSEWSVISEQPTPDERELLHWLYQHDASALVTDWRLNEGAANERVANYEADVLIRAIRTIRPTFPIFVVTGFAPDARAHLRDVENVFTREQFNDDILNIVPQVVRAGLRRYEQEKELFARMDALARKVATGSALAADRSELSSLHGYFQAEMPPLIRIDQVFKEFETIKIDTESLRQRIQARIDREKENPD
jgi:hypothetical protein